MNDLGSSSSNSRSCSRTFLIVLGCYASLWFVSIVIAHVSSGSASFTNSFRIVWLEVLFKLGVVFVPLLVLVLLRCARRKAAD